MSLPAIVDGMLALSAIQTSLTHLRKADRESAQFIALRENIRRHGVLQAIRVAPDEDSGCYQLIDGMQRFSALSDIVAESGGDASSVTIPVMLSSATTKSDVLAEQISVNASRVDTKPAEFARGCYQILDDNPSMTIGDLATVLALSPAWLTKVMRLTKLHEDVATAVDGGQITLSNAIALAGLPEDQQAQYLTEAQTESSEAFGERVDALKKAAQAANRGGGKPEFAPSIKLRSKNEVSGIVAPAAEAELRAIVADAPDSLTAARNALNWAMSLDPPTVAKNKAKWDQAQATREQRRKEQAAGAEARKGLSDVLKGMAPTEIDEIRKIAAERAAANSPAEEAAAE